MESTESTAAARVIGACLASALAAAITYGALWAGRETSFESALIWLAATPSVALLLAGAGSFVLGHARGKVDKAITLAVAGIAWFTIIVLPAAIIAGLFDSIGS